ncbi:MAG: hypothetical protein FWD91_02080 [Treponema sp.]|nr:hypothetical protein [Treponema sp.]
MEEQKRRYVGIDLGKLEYTIAIIGEDKKMSVRQRQRASTVARHCINNYRRATKWRWK